MSLMRWLFPMVIVVFGGLACAAAEPTAPADSADRPLKVPAGFVVERVAGPPLVNHPMNGCFDEEGRLFLTEAAGLNLKADDLLRQLPNSIKHLEASHGDGRFDKAVVFADKMTFPQGALWHNGALFTTAYPSLWRIDDAGRRTAIAGRFGSTATPPTCTGRNSVPTGCSTSATAATVTTSNNPTASPSRAAPPPSIVAGPTARTWTVCAAAEWTIRSKSPSLRPESRSSWPTSSSTRRATTPFCSPKKEPFTPITSRCIPNSA